MKNIEKKIIKAIEKLWVSFSIVIDKIYDVASPWVVVLCGFVITIGFPPLGIIILFGGFVMVIIGIIKYLIYKTSSKVRERVDKEKESNAELDMKEKEKIIAKMKEDIDNNADSLKYIGCLLLLALFMVLGLYPPLFAIILFSLVITAIIKNPMFSINKYSGVYNYIVRKFLLSSIIALCIIVWVMLFG